MKKFIISLVFIVLIFGCNSNKKSSEIANYSYNKKEISNGIGEKIELGDFVKKDSV
jgi:hypothetical protein